MSQNNNLFLIVLFITSGCKEIPNFKGLELPVIENATILGGESNLFQKNLSLLVVKKFPNHEVMKFYKDYFSTIGWIMCENQDSDNWYSFIDMSGIKDVRKFQRVRYFANFEKYIFGTFYLIYISDDLQNENFPSNDKQYLHITLEYSFNIKNDFSNACKEQNKYLSVGYP